MSEGKKSHRLLKIAVAGAGVTAGIIGVKKCFKTLEERSKDNDIRDYYCIFTGRQIKPEGEFRGMNIKSVLSGVEVDLSKAESVDGAEVKLSGALNGISLKVPNDVSVVIEKEGDMAQTNAISDRTQDFTDSEKTLKIVVESGVSAIDIRQDLEDDEDDDIVGMEDIFDN